MPLEVVKQRSRGFICVNAHPEGCARNVERQIEVVTSRSTPWGDGPRNVLVLGSSTGYGLAARIAATWGFQARTLGVFFERPPEGGRTATAGGSTAKPGIDREKLTPGMQKFMDKIEGLRRKHTAGSEQSQGTL